MIPIFASFSFEGVERWQIWFDNPNKAAILFAEMVIIGVWLAQHRKSIWFSIGYVVANAAAFALLHTMSRGGLLACGVGIAFVLRKGCNEFFMVRQAKLNSNLRNERSSR